MGKLIHFRNIRLWAHSSILLLLLTLSASEVTAARNYVKTLTMLDSTGCRHVTALQYYKYNGKELDRMHGLNLYDYGYRQS